MITADEKQAAVSYLEMSDDDISKMDPNSLDTTSVVEVGDTTDADEGDDSTDGVGAGVAGTEGDKVTEAKEDTSDDKNEATNASESDPEAKAGEVKEEAADAGTKEAVPTKAATDTVDTVGKVADTTTVVEPATVVVDYKAEYERLLKPFKANGKEVSVGNIDDAISLMQMGANYNKKMAGLKPNLKLMKLLENNGLLSEERIGFLIDLEKKDPAAINKLIKDSGLDPMDLDAGKAGDYTPKTYKVDDKEMELDTVLDSIQDSPSYNRTLDIVSTKWDGASKQTIAATPQLLKVINEHIESGIYDKIATEVERERVFGRLAGLSDIEAYRQVGDAIQARGGFANLGHQAQKPAPVVVQPKPKVLDETLKDKKRAASGNKLAAPSQPNKDFSPLGLSDDEFEKMAQSRFA